MAHDPCEPSGGTCVNLDSFLPDQLAAAARLSSQAFSRICAGKLTVEEWRILITVCRFGQTTSKFIGGHCYIHKTKVSRAVSSLEQKKLINRQSNGNDLRETFLSLTPSGQELCNKLAPLAKDFEKQILSALDPSDREALVRALGKLTELSKQFSRPMA